MDEFAEQTGLTGARPPKRYLWTDAHAVCNWLTLANLSGQARYLDLARRLVSQVHEILGRHRADDSRVGWISGLSDREGFHHPTTGGLRIGKPQPERQPGAIGDERAEWQQDGQYYHYLTKWMHALHQLSRHTGESEYSRWAVELAQAAHRGFRSRRGPARLYWKMSIDLSYPLVASSGHHDPLDGLITCLELSCGQTDPALTNIITDLSGMCQGRSWVTPDSLGIGGLLFDCGRLIQLPSRLSDSTNVSLPQLLQDVVESLAQFAHSEDLRRPASHRLAFRELGLAIGLQAFPIISSAASTPALERNLSRLKTYLPMQQTIENFWRSDDNQCAATWSEHWEINTVMLATSLTAAGFLSI